MKTRVRRRSGIRIGTMPLMDGHFWGGRVASWFFIALTCVLLLSSLATPTTLDSVRVKATDMSAPIIHAISQPFYQVIDLVSNVTGIAQLQSENAALRSENAKLKEWYQSAMILQSQNTALQDMLNLKVEPQNTYVTARIVADAGNAYAKSVVVSAGEKEGVAKNQAVLSQDGLLGRVIESGKTAARVLLLTDMNSRIPVFVESTAAEGRLERAILAGNNSGKLVLQHVAAGSLLKEGMRVVTSGHGGVFPPSLPVGTIERQGDGSLHVRPYADVHNTMYVRVVNAPSDPRLLRGDLD